MAGFYFLRAALATRPPAVLQHLNAAGLFRAWLRGVVYIAWGILGVRPAFLPGVKARTDLPPTLTVAVARACHAVLGRLGRRPHLTWLRHRGLRPFESMAALQLKLKVSMHESKVIKACIGHVERIRRGLVARPTRPARAGNRHFGLISALRAHTEPP